MMPNRQQQQARQPLTRKEQLQQLKNRFKTKVDLHNVMSNSLVSSNPLGFLTRLCALQQLYLPRRQACQ